MLNRRFKMLYKRLKLRDFSLSVVLKHLYFVTFVIIKTHGAQRNSMIETKVNVLLLVSVAEITISF